MSLDNVGTPWHIVRALESDHRAFGLDVCAEAWSAKAREFIGLPRDGLVEKWCGTNLCNPRYSVQAAWMLRASIEAAERGLTTACLVRAAQDTRYWFRLATSRGTTDFYVGRISFIAPPEGAGVRGSGGGRYFERIAVPDDGAREVRPLDGLAAGDEALDALALQRHASVAEVARARSELAALTLQRCAPARSSRSSWFAGCERVGRFVLIDGARACAGHLKERVKERRAP